MSSVRELSFLARPLADQETLGIGLGLVGLVTSLLAMKIHPAVAWSALIVISRPIFSLGPKTLKARPRFDQSPIHREMIIAHQPALSGLFHHRIEKQSSYFMLQQPIAVLAEHRGIETLFLKLHVQKPAKQQIVAQLLAKLPLAPHRVQRDQQQRLQNPLGGYRWPSDLGIHPVKHSGQFLKLLIRHPLNPSQRMVIGNAFLNGNKSQHARLSVLDSPHQRLRSYIWRHTNICGVLQIRKISKPES